MANMMTVDGLLHHAAGFARKAFNAQGQVFPMMIVHNSKGEITPVIMEMPGREDRDAVCDVVHDLLKKLDAVRYAIIVESWMLEHITEIPDSVLLGAPISQHPARREIILVQSEDKETSRMGMYYILRPEHGKAKLSEFKKMPTDSQNSGRFSNLLRDDYKQYRKLYK